MAKEEDDVLCSLLGCDPKPIADLIQKIRDRGMKFAFLVLEPVGNDGTSVNRYEFSNVNDLHNLFQYWDDRFIAANRSVYSTKRRR